MNINKIVIILSLTVAISMTALTVSRYASDYMKDEGENSGLTVEDIISEEEGDGDYSDVYLKSERD